MHTFKRIVGMLSFAVLAGVLLSVGASPAVEAGGPSHMINNNFAMVANPTLVPPTTASGSGKISYNTKKGEFDLTVKAQGLDPGVLYHVRQTIRNGMAGNVPHDAIIFNVGVYANSKGEIKVTRKNVEFELLDEPGVNAIGPWRIDQQITRADGGGSTNVNCLGCVIVCSPTTQISIVDGKLVGGW